MVGGSRRITIFLARLSEFDFACSLLMLSVLRVIFESASNLEFRMAIKIVIKKKNHNNNNNNNNISGKK